MSNIKDKLPNTRIIALIIGLVGILGTWFYFSPHLTLYGMQQAAQRKDATELSNHVDFPALKDNVKSTVRSQVVNLVTQKHQGNPLALLGIELADSLINSVVDKIVSPEGIAALMQGQTPLQNKDANAQQAINSTESKVSMGYESFNTFVVHVKNKAADREVGLVFSRDGLAWKLSALRLPQA